MKTMKRWVWALALMAGVLMSSFPVDAKPSMSHDGASHRLTRRGAAGHIAVRSGRKHFPKDAEVSLTRTHADSAKRKIKDGLKHRRHNVLAMYDISIKAGGKKWQPDAGDPVRVTVDLDEPVAVAATSNLGVAHLSDDGAVEELPASRYGFTYNASKTAVTSFWVDADGFSIYTIIDTDGELQTPRRFYHFYGHTSMNSTGTDIALPYQFRDQSNDVVNVQIVKDGDMLKEPPIPRDIVDENGEVVSMFEGWYVVSSNARPASAVESKLDNTNEYFQFVWPVGVTDMRMSFTNAVTVTETEDWDYHLVPLYENARFLQFNENAKEEITEGAGARIIRRKLVAINDETGVATLKVSDVEAALKNSRNEYFCGWEYLDTDGQYKQLLVYSDAGKHQDQYITVNDALFEANDGTVIPLYPFYVSAHFLHFNANAKSVDFVGSLFVRSTSNFSQVGVSGNRKGYDFAGWQAGFLNEETKELVLGVQVTDAQGNFIPNVTVTNAFTGAVAFYTDAAGNIRMNEDVTLYGTWVANSSASYRVIIWQQRVTDDKNAADEDKKYYYVTHYTSPAVPATTQIAQSLLTSFSGTRRDGTAVNGVNLTTLSGTSNNTGEDFTGFHYARWASTDTTVAPDGSTVINVYYNRNLITYTFSGGSNPSPMTGLYGQTLSANGYVWPTGNGLWQTTHNGQTTTVTFRDAFLPVGGDTETFNWNTTTGNTPIRFYKQALDGSWSLANTVNTSGGNFNISDKYNGFQAYQYRKKGTGNNGTWGNWTSVGTYNTSTKYYGSAVSSYGELEIRFARKQYELIYVYEDINGEHYLHTDAAVYFEKPLAEYDIAYTNVLLNWSECDIANRTFEGWYEDASLTVPFDFAATMPDGKKFIYAKWAPLKHKVIIDPNGGELLPSEATWFYVDPAKDETIEEYTPTRKYRLDMHYGTYYYHYDPWDPVNDKHVPEMYDPANSNAPRRAYYTQNIEEATTNEGSNPENRYTYDPGAYAFMGWYQVLDNGSLATDPFSFGEPPTGPVTLRAIWRRLGIYTLKYESVDPDGQQSTEIIYDPQRHASGNVEDGYVANAETTLAKVPTNYDKDEWLWEGWQVIDTYNNNIPLTTIRSPGDIYIVKPTHADLNNVIHFRAVYKRVGDGTSRHIPPVTDLILDSNDNAGLAVGATITAEPGRIGTYTDGSTATVGGLNQGVWFAGQQNNFSVNLADYTADFAHNYGYLLLGWDPLRQSDSLIPTYSVSQTIGIDKDVGSENILYAIWEPQIYIEFVNDTGADLNGVQLYIPSWVDGELFRVNTVTGTYGREVFSAFSNGVATFDLAANETLRLVLPDAADKDFAVLGNCTYAEGNKLVVTRIQPQIAGQEAIPDVTQSVYPGENYMVSGTMKVSPTPVQVVFTKDTYLTEVNVPVRYFLHLTNTTDGVIREITHDDAYWQNVDGNTRITNITVRAADIDLAAALRADADTSVHGFLATVRPDDGTLLREGFRCTTIGIGSATNDFEEYRTITKRDPSGGSYVHYRREHVEWSRYSYVWNAYDDAAVYVVFYRREPVHVTVAKSVIGSEEDKTRKFDFTADFTEKSKTFEYTVTTSYRKTRTIRSNAERDGFLNLGWGWSDTWTGPDWANCEEQPVSVGDPSKPALVSEDQFLFSGDGRESEDISLAHGERHPFTIYYNKLQDTDPSKTVTTGGTRTQSSISYYNSDGSQRNNSNAGNGRYRTRTETTNYTQTVTYLVTYQYETVTIREKNDPDNLFVLNSIDGDPDNPLANHNGTANVADRSYTISSLRGPDASGFYDYQLLDTAIFTNTRKTGSVTVSKTVVNGDAGDTFPFTVTLGETVVGKDTYTPPAGVHLGPYGKVFTFSLADGGSVTLTNLPAGASYKVEEGAHAKYVATIPANATGAIAADTTIAVGVTNTRKTDLVITMNSVTNYFTGTEQHGYDISTVTGTGSPVVTDGYTVTGLKEGHVLTVEHHVPSHGTAVGEYMGDFSNARYTIHDAEGNDVTQEYLVTTPVADTMVIQGTPIIVEVTGNTTTATYDGTEHVCQGYTYVVKNAITGEVIENENVLVSVDPNYQHAYQTNVGKTEMLLEGHVNVTVPEGFTLQEVTVVGKGYMEITPAPVTVTVDSVGKQVGAADPALAATVTGLIGNDQIEYTLTRESGEDMGEYTITASGETTQGNYTVTYVNGTFTINGLPVDLHVAVTEDGTIVNGDKDLRSENPADYTVELGISDPMTAGEIAATTNTLFKEEMDDGNHFVGVYYGTTNEQGQVTIGGEVTQIGLVKPEGSDSYVPCVNGDPTIPLSDYQVYVLYCELPKIYYVSADAKGALTKRDKVTLNGNPVAMGNAGETAAAQGTLLEVGADAAFTVAEGSGTSDFRVPTTLDGTTQASLNFIAFGAGAADLASTNAMNGVTLGNTIQLKIVDLVLKWSVDGETWSTFTSKPAVYAIYKDGHDLTINATSLASADDKATDTFTVTITSENLVDGVPYAISGYTDSNGNPIETVTPVNGVITLTLKSDDSVTIQSLQNDGTNPYVVTQTPNAEDYDKTDITVNGSTPSTVSEDGSVSIVMDGDTVVDITNTKSYDVTFLDADGTQISTGTYPYGTTSSVITDGVDNPTKPMDETSIYRFDGWGPTVETVGSNTTYTAGYTEIKIPQATQRQDDTNIVVNLDKETPQQGQEALVEALKEAGIDVLSPDYSEEAANEILNSVDPNGMRHWENLVTGSDTNALALSTASGEDDEATFHLTAGSDGGKYVDLGYIVLHDLRKLEDGRWNRKDGPKAGANPDFTIRLLDDEGRSIGATGLYRVYTLIIPKHDLAITNEIPSTNIVGVLEIESTMTNTLAAVPWHMLASDPAVPTNISVSAWVQTNQLAGATYVRALHGGDYQMWQLSDDNWTPFTTTRARNGGTESTEAEDAFSRRLRRGEPVWLTRTDVSKGSFFLIGQFSPDPVTEEIEGGDGESLTPTLLTNPTFLPMAINSLTWGGTPDRGDQILIPSEDDTPTLLTWNGSNWGASALEQYEKNGRMRTRVVRRTDFTIPPGRGFWYYRKTPGGMSVTFPAIPCN